MKILLKKVNFGSHTVGEEITSPKDLSAKEAEYLVSRGWAEEVNTQTQEMKQGAEERKKLYAQAKKNGFNPKLHENAKKTTLEIWIKLREHRKKITSKKLLEDLQQDATQKKEEIPDKISSKALRIILETVEVSDAQKDKTDSS